MLLQIVSRRGDVRLVGGCNQNLSVRTKICLSLNTGVIQSVVIKHVPRFLSSTTIMVPSSPLLTHRQCFYMFSAGLSFLSPFCAPVSDSLRVIYLFSPSLVSHVLRCCSLCSLVISWLSQHLNFCFAHSGRSSYSTRIWKRCCSRYHTLSVTLPTCKFSQSLSVWVTLLWSSAAWTLLENSQNWFLLRAKRLLSLLLQKKEQKEKIPSVP